MGLCELDEGQPGLRRYKVLAQLTYHNEIVLKKKKKENKTVGLRKNVFCLQLDNKNKQKEK